MNPYGILRGGLLLLITVHDLLLLLDSNKVQITEGEVGRGAEIEETLDYVYRQLGQLRIIADLPKSHVPTEPVLNSALDVKSAVMMYVAVNLSHQCNRFGIAGILSTAFPNNHQEKLASLYFSVTKRSSRLGLDLRSRFSHSILLSQLLGIISAS